MHVHPGDNGGDVEDRVLLLLADAHAPAEAVEARDALGLHVHAKNPREGDGRICANETCLHGIQDAAVVETGSRRRERMGLELDDTGLDIVCLWIAGWLLVDDFWRIVAVHVVIRLTLARSIFTLVLIADTSAAGHLAVAFALALAT